MIRHTHFAFVLAVTLLASDLCLAGENQTCFLHPHEKIMWVGDSITAQNLYEPYVMNVLHTLYPDGDCSMVNAGVGGATASSRFGGIPQLVETERPTLITVMFGVNDTGWSPGNDQQKVENYSKGLSQYIDLARQKKIDLLFIHETHFSHNLSAQSFEIGLDALLMKLFSAEDQLAADSHIGVIDGYGAYLHELNKAWQVDPKYEFTPNVVHPTMLGHSAVAGEILRAFGAGLPLATGGSRPPLAAARHSVDLSAKRKAAFSPPVSNCRLFCRPRAISIARFTVIWLLSLADSGFLIPFRSTRKGMSNRQSNCPPRSCPGDGKCSRSISLFWEPMRLRLRRCRSITLN